MTASRDPDRLIHAYLLEGAEHLQDRVYDAVRADIEERRQKGRFGPWRMPIMNKLVPIGLGAAAVVVVLVVGTRLLGPSGPTGPGAGKSAEPSATPVASLAEPSAQPTSTPEGLPEGSHALWEGPPAVTVAISEPGWYGVPGEGIVSKDDNADAPDGAGIIIFAGDIFVYGNPCQWRATRPAAAATTVDAAVAALAAQESRNASAPVDVAVGGYAGKSITLHVPDDAVFSDCDQSEFRTLAEGVDGARYAQDPGQIDKLWVLDVEGVLVVIDAAYYEGTPQAVVDEMEAIVESATFK